MIGARKFNDTIARLHYATWPLLRRDFTISLNGLLVTQWWPEDRLRALQEKRLQDLLTHAWLNVPFYRSQIDGAGLNPRTATVDQLRSLPILEKATIQAESAKLLSRGVFPGQPGLITNHTGGSTGEPLTFYQDEEYFTGSMAELRRDFFFCGYRPGDRQAFLWGSDRDFLANIDRRRVE